MTETEPRELHVILRDWDRTYRAAWQRGLRQALLDGRVTLSHEVGGQRVMLDPARYASLAIIPPPPRPGVGLDPMIVLGSTVLCNVLFHEIPSAKRT